ncbi:MAG: hypothetical protein JWQ84_2710 [Mucilaginibacter sp.]|nr:hypothetical protein [Mucilaginibacter sp.]MDB5017878.1 hypothetical protein [Mucilaginibacter sp.]
MDTSINLNQAINARQQPKTIKIEQTIQPYVYATVFSSLCIIVGLIWDISWHTSIGRDGLLAPPHDVIYLGAVCSGLFSAYQILRITFWGSLAEKQGSVKFWGIFYGPLGAMFCIWGAIAMLTSAPFDDWWHNTYGLDVVILSPPHTLLAIGIGMIQLGAMVTVLSSLHSAKSENVTLQKLLFIISAGLLLTSFYVLFSEYLNRSRSHSALCYQVAAILFPMFLIAVVRASKMRWAATATAAVHMSVLLLMLWILPLFHAVPRLGPVLNHFDHYQPFHFPLLLIIPAIVIDLLIHRPENQKPLTGIIPAAVLFLLVFFVVQWYFGAFLQTSPFARNWFFGSYAWYFGANPDWPYRYSFHPDRIDTGFALIKGILIATVISALSGLVGYKWGGWMKKVQR